MDFSLLFNVLTALSIIALLLTIILAVLMVREEKS